MTQRKKEPAEKAMDEVLKRMLSTPPQPHVTKKQPKRAKKARKQTP
jgi:hypothetical protein